MKNIINVLAKEVRRARAFVKVAEGYGVTYPTEELEVLRRILAMLIKKKT